jgi:hypothetical protein
MGIEIVKLCNHHKDCTKHEGRCIHRKLHSDTTIECNEDQRASAGLQKSCYHFSNQRCIELTFKEVKK